MSFSYVVRTGNHLPSSKKIFDCKCEAIKYIKNVIQNASPDLSDGEINHSYSVHRVDSEICGSVHRFFKESSLCYVPSEEELEND